MKNNYEQNLSCTFAEQLAAYLYDEITGAEKDSFESHLPNCRICTNELADFSALRSSVLEWRETDFAPLPTPLIVLPAPPKIAAEKSSWFETFRTSFTLSPARTVLASLLALLVFAGLFWVASKSVRHEDLADLDTSEKETIKEERSPNRDEAELSPSPSPAKQNVARGKSDERFDDPATTNKFSSGRKTNAAPDKATPIQVTQKNSLKPAKQNTNPKIKPPARNEIPAMDDDDDEDKSLRLTDLFDEIGMNNSAGREESNK